MAVPGLCLVSLSRCSIDPTSAGQWSSEAEGLLPTVDAVLAAPELATGRGDEQVQAVGVVELPRLVADLRVLDFLAGGTLYPGKSEKAGDGSISGDCLFAKRICLVQIRKKRHQGRFLVSFQNLENSMMVEAAGIEPASASPLPSALHAYPSLLF